jgi:hypothetical protein
MKTIFTTGQVSKICKVAPRTVSKWFDSGRLAGYLIPGSQDRRIPREHLIRFMTENNIPLGELQVGILVMGVRGDFKTLLTDAILQASFHAVYVNNELEMGAQIAAYYPRCIIIECEHEKEAGVRCAIHLRADPRFRDTNVVGLGLSQAELSNGSSGIFTETFRKPFDVNLLIARLHKLTLTPESETLND